jgi:hypothetical protein
VLKHKTVESVVVVEENAEVMSLSKRLLSSLSLCSFVGDQAPSCFDVEGVEVGIVSPIKWVAAAHANGVVGMPASCNPDLDANGHSAGGGGGGDNDGEPAAGAAAFDVIIVDLDDLVTDLEVGVLAREQQWGPVIASLFCLVRTTAWTSKSGEAGTSSGAVVIQLGRAPLPTFADHSADGKARFVDELVAHASATSEGWAGSVFVYNVYLPSDGAERSFAVVCFAPACAERWRSNSVGCVHF